MEELAKLEEEGGNPAYGRNSDFVAGAAGGKGGRDHCAGYCGNVY